MLIRIVKMTFNPEDVDNFLTIFQETKNKIRSFEGCEHLELLEDLNNKNSYSTYSHWENETALNAYRNSHLFDGVWAKTKVLFAEKPIAFSLKNHTTVEL